jgi:membrane associated rhomboid family serine protease
MVRTAPNTKFWKRKMPEGRTQQLLKSYEFSSIAFLLSTVVCGIAAVLRPSLIEWAVGLFLLLGALSGVMAAYLLVRHAYRDPRFKTATLIVWTSVTVFAFALLWVQYGIG